MIFLFVFSFEVFNYDCAINVFKVELFVVGRADHRVDRNSLAVRLELEFEEVDGDLLALRDRSEFSVQRAIRVLISRGDVLKSRRAARFLNDTGERGYQNGGENGAEAFTVPVGIVASSGGEVA